MWEELQVAIIERGLKDLLYYIVRLKKANKNTKSSQIERWEKKAAKIEKELRSDWCRSLTELDIDTLIRGVKEKV